MPSMSEMSINPFQWLHEHAASRAKMTKAELLKDAADGDEAYINASAERDTEEAYRKSLEGHLRKAHGCTHDPSAIVDELDAEELHPATPWNDVSD